MTTILIPMAGMGSRFSEAGFTKSKPFIDVCGLPMITRVLENLYFPTAKFILGCRREQIIGNEEIIKSLTNNYDVRLHIIESLTQGTACTVLDMLSTVDDSESIVVANCDQIIDSKIVDFINAAALDSADGSIMTFNESSRDPKWSYVKCNSDRIVTEVKEKVAISENASVGIYYMSSTRIYKKFAECMITQSDTVNGEFYVCPIFNYIIKSGLKVTNYTIKKTQMHGLGTPEDYSEYCKILKT